MLPNITRLMLLPEINQYNLTFLLNRYWMCIHYLININIQNHLDSCNNLLSFSGSQYVQHACQELYLWMYATSRSLQCKSYSYNWGGIQIDVIRWLYCYKNTKSCIMLHQNTYVSIADSIWLQWVLYQAKGECS